MASNIYLISGGTNYYLSGSGASTTPYSGSGTPWTAQATTPYKIAMNDVGGRWTPQAAPQVPIYAGGPPQRSGRSLLYLAYDQVQESIPIQMYGTNEDNAVALLHQLRKLLNQSLTGQPTILAVQPNGQSNTVYFELSNGNIQEDERFINDEAGLATNVIRAMMTVTRSYVGGALSSGESLFSSTTFTNIGTGANNNTQAYPGSLSGEFTDEGQPINLKVTRPTLGIGKLFLASVYSRTYSTAGGGGTSYSTTNTTDGAFNSSPGTFDLAAAITRNGLKPRILARTTAFGANAQASIQIRFYSGAASGAGTIIYQAPWIDRGSTATVQYVDFGTFPLDRARLNGTAATIQVAFGVRSTDGNTATINIDYFEVLLYYEFCTIDMTLNTSGTIAAVVQFQEVSGRPCIPLGSGAAATIDSSDFGPYGSGVVRGTLPRYHTGASFFIDWVGTTTPTHTKTETVSVTATQSPLWRTFRGGD